MGLKGRSLIQNTKHDLWYCKNTNQVFHMDELLSKKIIKDETQANLLPGLGYVWVFQVDVVNLMKRFIEEKGSTTEKKHFQKIPDIRYAYEWRVYIDHHHDFGFKWVQYEHLILQKEAIRWCEENGIKYCMDDPNEEEAVRIFKEIGL